MLGWMKHGEKSSVFMAHLVWDFSSGTTSKNTDFNHFLLMWTVILGFGKRLAPFTGLLRGFEVVTWKREFPNLLHSETAKSFPT